MLVEEIGYHYYWDAFLLDICLVLSGDVVKSLERGAVKCVVRGVGRGAAKGVEGIVPPPFPLILPSLRACSTSWRMGCCGGC